MPFMQNCKLDSFSIIIYNVYIYSLLHIVAPQISFLSYFFHAKNADGVKLN